MGDYLECMHAIIRSWRLIQEQQTHNPDLIVRLGIRLAKALSNGARGGYIMRQDAADCYDVAQSLKKAAFEQQQTTYIAASRSELDRVWQEWEHSVYAFGADQDGAILEASRRLSSLPIFSKSAYVSCPLS